MKKLIAIALACGVLAGCDTDATVASRNLSQAADNFEINRRIVFYNGITDTYMLSIEGLCSLEPKSDRIHVCDLQDRTQQFQEAYDGPVP